MKCKYQYSCGVEKKGGALTVLIDQCLKYLCFSLNMFYFSRACGRNVLFKTGYWAKLK